MRRRFRLVASGACAVAATALCLLYGQGVREEAEQARAEALERYGGEVVSLVVATEGIEAGEVVDRTNVAERDWLVDLVPEGAVTAADEVLGAEVSVPVAAGLPLTTLNFRDAAGAVEVPADRVALSVPLADDLGLPPAVTAGTTLAAFEVTDAGTRLLADDLQVLATAQESAGLAARGSITLAVAPADVPSVLSASAEGSLRLALPGEGSLDLGAGGASAPTDVPAEGSSPGGGEGDARGEAADEELGASGGAQGQDAEGEGA